MSIICLALSPIAMNPHAAQMRQTHGNSTVTLVKLLACTWRMKRWLTLRAQCTEEAQSPLPQRPAASQCFKSESSLTDATDHVKSQLPSAEGKRGRVDEKRCPGAPSAQQGLLHQRQQQAVDEKLYRPSRSWETFQRKPVCADSTVKGNIISRLIYQTHSWRTRR